MATNVHTKQGGARRRTVVFFTLFALAGAACTASLGASLIRPAAHDAAEGSYGWPVKPFDQPHPIRGSFGDPRTSFDGAPTPAGLNGSGSFAFHQGVDISAPDGTAVYAVKSGVAHVRTETVVVSSENDVRFEYWHIVPSVREGQQVTAFKTVLGHIRPGGWEHVHLTELRNSRPVNPLAPGHLTPYADATTPTVDDAVFLPAGSGRTLVPEFLKGSVQFVVSATDLPAMPVPGRWNGLPVAPARLVWHVERAKDAQIVVPRSEAFDVRESLPASSEFWSAYLRGSRQNMANFAGHKAWRQPGVYLFRLTGSFDTRRLKDDVYVLVATASDTRGNAGTGRFVFTVHNKPGFFGG